MIEFTCENKTKSKREKWKGTIKSIDQNDDFYELRIQSRSSIHVIVGKTKYGSFACMPDFGAGCHIASLKDIFWNTEKLT